MRQQQASGLRALRRRRIVAGALALGSFAPAWAENVVKVGIRDYRFVPAELTVKVGTAVRWTNHERRASHSVLFGGQESERMLPGESWQRVFDRPGRYSYSCGPHPEMNGLVLVTE